MRPQPVSSPPRKWFIPLQDRCLRRSRPPQLTPCARQKPLCSRQSGLPNRPWYRHTIYAPGEYTGYAAVVIPGVNEAIDANDASRATQQLAVLSQAIDQAATTLLGAR